jgi:hypothetical protein
MHRVQRLAHLFFGHAQLLSSNLLRCCLEDVDVRFAGRQASPY